MRQRILAAALLLNLAAGVARADVTQAEPRVLAVIAHPDDETTFAGTLFKIARQLHGTVDLAVITNGAGGFRYATLAELLYDQKLTAEPLARAHLPRIRKRELIAAGAILGVHDYFFFDQKDAGYTRDSGQALEPWNVPRVRSQLTEILERGGYGFVLLLLPTATTHGAHQAAALLALEAVARLPAAERPAVLGGLDLGRGALRPDYAGLPGQPLTAVGSEAPVLEFDRGEPLGFGARLDYRIVANWVIAEYKSQGLLQTEMNAGEREPFYVFALNEPAAVASARALFARPGGARAEPVLESRWRPFRALPAPGVCPIPR